jgi:hypothetical protein
MVALVKRSHSLAKKVIHTACLLFRHKRNSNTMNMHPALAGQKLRSAARTMTKLKAWRKRQMVRDKASGAMRPMRLTDVPEHYGIAWQTWHGWEQPPGHKDFKRPNDENMRRVCVEITRGELTPADFYQLMDTDTAISSGG